MALALRIVLLTHVATLAASDRGEQPFVVAGRGFSLFVDRINGQVMAAGANDYGQTGIGASDAQDLCPSLVNISNDAEVVDAAAGAFHSLFLMSDGSVYATGRNHKGQLGDGSRIDKVEPAMVESAGVIAVAAGYAHSLFLYESGEVMAWGWNAYGQLGDGTTTGSSSNGTKALLSGVKKIAAGYDFSYFLMDTKEVFAAGNNLGGQLGDGTRQTSSTPVKVEIDGVTAIAAGATHGLFLKDTGVVFATGANYAGQLGDSSSELKDKPVETFVRHIDTMSAGGDSNCFIRDGVLFGTGSNLDGQLGLGSTEFAREPVAIPTNQIKKVERFMSAGVSDTHILVVDLVGSVLASGKNEAGGLGDCTTQSTDRLKASAVVAAPSTTTTTTSTTTATVSTTTSSTSTTTTVTDVYREPKGMVTETRPILWMIFGGLTAMALGISIVVQGRVATNAFQAGEQEEMVELETARPTVRG